MLTDRVETIAVLSQLATTCRDAEQAHEAAANGVDDDMLRDLFAAHARKYAQLAAELQGEIRRLGGDPSVTGTVAGRLRRGWISVEAFMTGGDETELLAECERGEEVMKSAYEAARERPLPAAAGGLVARHSVAVTAMLHRIRDLRRVA